MSAPLAYFISWTTKGTWLHGDERGFVERGKAGIQEPDRLRNEREYLALRDEAVLLGDDQRRLVHRTIAAHCNIRKWKALAVNVRTNHVHVVVNASDAAPETVMEQFKAWCSRRLNEMSGHSRKWWTPHGSTRWINDEASLEAAIEYVLNRQ
ncbi:MAG: transposase [Phycisphaerales bacterium]|nr:transposase [Phycisphaerales bacterium]